MQQKSAKSNSKGPKILILFIQIAWSFYTIDIPNVYLILSDLEDVT